MTNKCLRRGIAACLLGWASVAMAYDFQVNGIYYSKNEEGDQVSVVKGDNYGSYSGDIVIPEYVYYGGNSYDVTSIEWDAFQGCSGVTTVTVADAAISGLGAFRWCWNLKAFYVTRPEWQSWSNYLSAEDGVLMDAAKTQIWAYPRGRKGNYTIPATVSELYSDTFDGCSIDTLTLSSGQAEYTMYLGNVGAKVLVFPEGVTTIGENIFSWNGQTIILPSTISSIGSNAFGTYEYPEKVYCLASEPPSIAADAFGTQPNTWSGSTLYVPKGSEAQYANAEGWKTFTQIVGVAFNAPDTYDVVVAGTLKDVLPDVSQLKTAITITGLLNGDDIIYLRSLFQGDSRLQCLNLSGAQMVDGGESYYATSSKKFYTKDGHVTPYLFNGFSSMHEVVLPQSTMAIDEEGMNGAYGLRGVTLPEGIRQVGRYAFSQCHNLEAVNLPNTIDSIGDGAFSGCESLQSLTLPTSIAYLPNGICGGCTSLQTIHIPSNIRFVKYPQYFGNCTQLTAFTVDADHPLYTAVDGAIYTRDLKTLVLWPTAKDMGATATIPAGTEVLGISSLYDSRIKDISLPVSLRTVGEAAFYDSTVEHIQLPDMTDSIGRIAFCYCLNLKTLTLPKHLKTITEQMCQSCKSLTEINIPATVSTIDGHAFENCNQLERVIVESNKPLTINKRLIPDWDPFPSHSSIYLLVPEGSKAHYEADYYWSTFKEIVEYEVKDKQCAPPTIVYDHGHLLVNCESPEEAECHVNISCTDAGEYSGHAIDLTPTYTITVWATAEDYADSPRVTATIKWGDGRPVFTGFSSVVVDTKAYGDINGDNKVDIVDVTSIIDMILKQ